MFEPEREPVYDSHRDKGRFRVETDRMEAVSRQAHHVFFPTCDEEQIPLPAAVPARNNSYRQNHRQYRNRICEHGRYTLICCLPIYPNIGSSALVMQEKASFPDSHC